jgi:predicted ArsR family transcriptional regulator
MSSKYHPCSAATQTVVFEAIWDGGELTVDDIADELAMPKQTVRSALAALLSKGEVIERTYPGQSNPANGRGRRPFSYRVAMTSAASAAATTHAANATPATTTAGTPAT